MTKKLDGLENEVGKTGKRKAFFAFVLDESGSMSTGKQATITGMNEQIQQIRSTFKDSADVEPIITFVKFNGIVTPLYVNKGLEELKDFTDADYNPNGMTAMYDAVGYVLNTLDQAEGINDEDTSVLVVVVSDGAENSSREHTAHTIADRVKSYNDTKRWTFTYLGSNVDLTQVRANTGFAAGNTVTFDSSNAIGYTQAFGSHNMAFNSYVADMNISARGLRSAKKSLAVDNFYTQDAGSNSSSATITADNKTEAKA
jgi:hypothetical protein